MSLREQVRSRLRVPQREFPDPPQFPEEMTKTAMQAYRQASAEWWTKLKGQLVEMEAQLQNQR